MFVIRHKDVCVFSVNDLETNHSSYVLHIKSAGAWQAIVPGATEGRGEGRLGEAHAAWAAGRSCLRQNRDSQRGRPFRVSVVYSARACFYYTPAPWLSLVPWCIGRFLEFSLYTSVFFSQRAFSRFSGRFRWNFERNASEHGAGIRKPARRSERERGRAGEDSRETRQPRRCSSTRDRPGEFTLEDMGRNSYETTRVSTAESHVQASASVRKLDMSHPVE